MDWTRHQLIMLQDALTRAFPTASKLSQLVSSALGVKLKDITAERSLDSKVFDVMQWAIGNGGLENLVRVAMNQNPDDPNLQRAASDFFQLSAPSSPESSTLPSNVAISDPVHPTLKELKIEALMKRRNSLVEDYQSTNDQIIVTGEGPERNRLLRLLEALERNIADIDDSLAKLQAG